MAKSYTSTGEGCAYGSAEVIYLPMQMVQYCIYYSDILEWVVSVTPADKRDAVAAEIERQSSRAARHYAKRN